jgi:hypothetical protein
MKRAFLMLMVAVLLSGCFGGGGRVPAHPLGSEVTIKEGMLGAVDDDSFAELIKLSSASDATGVRNMVNQGHAVFFDQPARATVIGRGMERLELRVESGPHKDQSVWVVDGAVE